MIPIESPCEGFGRKLPAHDSPILSLGWSPPINSAATTRSPFSAGSPFRLALGSPSRRKSPRSPAPTTCPTPRRPRPPATIWCTTSPSSTLWAPTVDSWPRCQRPHRATPSPADLAGQLSWRGWSDCEDRRHRRSFSPTSSLHGGRLHLSGPRTRCHRRVVRYSRRKIGPLATPFNARPRHWRRRGRRTRSLVSSGRALQSWPHSWSSA